MGQVSEWKASFPWLIGPKNMAKVLGGQYHRGVEAHNSAGGYLDHIPAPVSANGKVHQAPPLRLVASDSGSGEGEPS